MSNYRPFAYENSTRLINYERYILKGNELLTIFGPFLRKLVM